MGSGSLTLSWEVGGRACVTGGGVSLLLAGTGARVGGAGVIVVAGPGRASGREGCFIGEVSSVGPERMLANDMGSAARACF